MFNNIKEYKGAFIFLILSALILSLGFYFGVLNHNQAQVVADHDVNTAETTEITTAESTSFSITESTTAETTSETTTIVQIDDTPGVIEVPNLVPDDGVYDDVEITTEEVSSADLDTCTFSVNCSTIIDNMDKLDDAKKSIVPDDGVIYESAQVEIKEGDTVFSILERELVLNNVHFEYNRTASVYIEGIANIYEFDCGDLSGWMYKVNGEFPHIGCDKYVIKPGDVVEWVYTCDLGRDVGDNYVTGS